MSLRCSSNAFAYVGVVCLCARDASDRLSSQEPNTELYKPALETLRTLIRTSTSSMTSVPKPLKFLHPHYPALQELYETWPPSEDKVCITRAVFYANVCSQRTPYNF